MRCCVDVLADSRRCTPSFRAPGPRDVLLLSITTFPGFLLASRYRHFFHNFLKQFTFIKKFQLLSSRPLQIHQQRGGGVKHIGASVKT